MDAKLLSGALVAELSGIDLKDSSENNHNLIIKLKEKGITNKNILGAIKKVPRELFVNDIAIQQAYRNIPLPIANLRYDIFNLEFPLYLYIWELIQEDKKRINPNNRLVLAPSITPKIIAAIKGSNENNLIIVN